MGNLERLQILTEVVGEFRTSILMDNEPEKTGQLVLEVIEETGDSVLHDYVLNAYLKLPDADSAVRYLKAARDYLFDKIDRILN